MRLVLTIVGLTMLAIGVGVALSRGLWVIQNREEARLDAVRSEIRESEVARIEAVRQQVRFAGEIGKEELARRRGFTKPGEHRLETLLP